MRLIALVYVVYVILFVALMHLYGDPETAYNNALDAIEDLAESGKLLPTRPLSEAPTTTYY